MKTKSELRKKWKDHLSHLTLDYRQASSIEVSRNLLKLIDGLNVHSKNGIIGAFAPFQQEPDWHLEWNNEWHDRTAFPAIENEKMIFRLARMSDLKNKNDFGPKIMGPAEDKPLIWPAIVLIPALAFDERGHRLGRGKGFYDRTFEARNDVVKIGVAFDSQITDQLPIEAHDVKMDFIVTEKRIINCTSV